LTRIEEVHKGVVRVEAAQRDRVKKGDNRRGRSSPRWRRKEGAGRSLVVGGQLPMREIAGEEDH
jgi:hypothetical protein